MSWATKRGAMLERDPSLLKSSQGGFSSLVGFAISCAEYCGSCHGNQGSKGKRRGVPIALPPSTSSRNQGLRAQYQTN